MVIEGTHYSPKCFCKNCKKIKIMDEKVSLQKESEWEKEFDKKFWIYFVQYYPEKENGLFGSIKSFIYQTIANREKEIAEEVVKLGVDSDETNKISVDRVLSILKH